jgi:hypothetical protein
VADGVDGLAEDDVLKAFVAVGAHDEQVGLEPAGEADDLLLGVARVRVLLRPAADHADRHQGAAGAGFKPVDLLAGLKETYRWYLRHHERKEVDYSFEDRLMAPPQQPAMQAGAGAAAH